MVTFNDVLPLLVQVVESLPDFDQLRKCAVVRDLRGRVRLIIDEDPNGPAFDRPSAEHALTAALGEYFVPPIWTKRGKPDETRLASVLLARAQRFPINYTAPDSGQRKPSHEKWHKYESRLSKTAWLDSGTADRVWDLVPGAPCITTFFSFKGGIGRTTALAACAWQLAREGTKVVVIDLDLEAPGAGALLGAQTARGILDVLVDTLATGQVDLEDSHAPAAALGAEADNVTVFPAGALGDDFIEKLARLDFTQVASDAATKRSPIEDALRDILRKIKSEFKPAHIFLDARSGLHDLSALSLLRLAHTDVLLARANEQSYQGLDLTFRTLLRRKGPEGLQTVIVHTMAAGGGAKAEIEERQEFNERVHDIYNRALYIPMNLSYPPDKESAPHFPQVLFFNNDLVRFGNLERVREALSVKEYYYLCERIKVYATPPSQSLTHEEEQ